MPSETINVGMIGGGQIARAHVLAYKAAPLLHGVRRKPELSMIAEATEQLAKDASRKYGFDSFSGEWTKVTGSPDLELVDIITPTYLHAEQAIDAVEHHKHVICEKPLASSAKDAREMYEAAKKAGVVNMVGFNYRRLPAVTYAKKLFESGWLGKLYGFRASFLEDWGANLAMLRTWRYEESKAGAGALADLGSHLIDLARYLVGDVKSVSAIQDTFIRERSLPDGSKGKVDVDDSTVALLRFKESEALGHIEASWCAQGRKVFLEFELNGSDGSVYYNLERANELKIYSKEDEKDKQGYRTVLMGPLHPYGSASVFPAPAAGMGYEDSVVNEVAELLSAMDERRAAEPSFYDGWKASEAIEAIKKSSATQSWVSI